MGRNCKGLAWKVLEFAEGSMFIFLIIDSRTYPNYILLLFDVTKINDFFPGVYWILFFDRVCGTTDKKTTITIEHAL